MTGFWRAGRLFAAFALRWAARVFTRRALRLMRWADQIEREALL